MRSRPRPGSGHRRAAPGRGRRPPRRPPPPASTPSERARSSEVGGRRQVGRPIRPRDRAVPPGSAPACRGPAPRRLGRTPRTARRRRGSGWCRSGWSPRVSDGAGPVHRAHGRGACIREVTRARKSRQRRSLSWTSPAESLNRSAARSISSTAEWRNRALERGPTRSSRSAVGVRSTRSSTSTERWSRRPASELIDAACQSLAMIRCRSPRRSASSG